MLKEGEKAPDFLLPDQHGNPVKLSEMLAQKNVVLYFYPKDETSGCTKQACFFRDMYEEFQEQGAEVIGISSDDAASHSKFAQKHQLPFVLVADAGGKVRKQYKVPRTLGVIPGRVTYVIDKTGTIRYTFNSMTKPLEHVQNTLKVLKNL
ncbi:peroxiredoxin [Rufibacter roseus]|uniref:thioredoxin-dependent peroxiredoxin n=1 Tax=Rufibacter roseus TaxID=1567108 RepID=A0ABW2DPB4_9BACT|nr:peroxiredoxin [Rufibacter roseus]